MSAVPRPRTAPVDLTTPTATNTTLRSFWRLADAWQLSTTEQTTLLNVGRTTLYQWKQNKINTLNRHQLERLSYLFGIYAALQILFPVARRANEWLRKPNAAPVFG